MHNDARAQAYVIKREAEPKNRKEIIRCLKRHIARGIDRLITNPPPTPNCARLAHPTPTCRHHRDPGAQAVGTHPSRISALELGRDHNHHLATRYQTWLHTHQEPHRRFDNHRSIEEPL